MRKFIKLSKTAFIASIFISHNLVTVISAISSGVLGSWFLWSPVFILIVFIPISFAGMTSLSILSPTITLSSALQLHFLKTASKYLGSGFASVIFIVLINYSGNDFCGFIFKLGFIKNYTAGIQEDIPYHIFISFLSLYYSSRRAMYSSMSLTI